MKPNLPRPKLLADDEDKTARRRGEEKGAYVTRLRSRELTRSIQQSRFPNSRPRDAATLLVLDSSGAEPKLLMGKRHEKLKFMPGKFVFPGGRVEPQDYLATAGCQMPTAMTQKLLRRVRGVSHSQRAYALAHAALRETQEETGLVLGSCTNARDEQESFLPVLGGLSFIARAITPPRRPRRFDTRFFTISAERISGSGQIVDGEFTAIEWFTLSQARQQDLPIITRIILDDLEERLAAGTLHDLDAPVPFYFMRGACFHRKLL
jgi:8-oxo-dGTP pyrophosphatase MutT (NUDIX family)